MSDNKLPPEHEGVSPMSPPSPEVFELRRKANELSIKVVTKGDFVFTGADLNKLMKEKK